MRTGPWEVDDAFWQRVEPLIPPVAPGRGPGRPRVDDRRVIGAIVCVLRTGAQWNAIPRRLCSSSTAGRRFQEWERAGFFRWLWEAGLLEYDAVRGIGGEWQAADGSMTTAPLTGPFGDAAVGPNPTDRGKPGGKRSLLTDAAVIARGYLGDTVRRGEDPRPRPLGPGNRARRWVVERTFSWLNRSRRWLVRWENKKENYRAFVHLAFAQLLFSKVARLSG